MADECTVDTRREREDWAALAALIKSWGRALGLTAVGIADTDLAVAEAHLGRWLAGGFHGEMGYMARHGTKRSRPAELVPGTLRVICARLDYLPPAADPHEALADPARAFVSRYALGRDYHRVLRRRLARLAERVAHAVGDYGHRVWVDTGPVLEKALAERAGLGWIGKHTNLIARDAGSWFFLGEIYTDLPLPADSPTSAHCGRCRACLDICPTRAIVAPYRLDARRCISYLTIELEGPIPEPLRAPLGNRVFGCDDCQLVCPWNRFARASAEPDFRPRHDLDRATLVDLFAWTEDEFLARTAGSAIRRIGHARWLRNLAVALGNAAPDESARRALAGRSDHPAPIVREHVRWALARHAAMR